MQKFTTFKIFLETGTTLDLRAGRKKPNKNQYTMFELSLKSKF